MTMKALPWIGLALAVGGLALLLAQQPAEVDDEPEALPPAPPPVVTGDEPLAAPPAPPPAPVPEVAPASGVEPIDPRTVPRGDLVLLPVDADGNPIDPDHLRMRLVREGRDMPAAPVAMRDVDRKTWRFEQVAVGDVRIHVTGDNVRDRIVKATITEEPQDVMRVVLLAAGAIRYRVLGAGPDHRANVTLALFDDADAPVRAQYEDRSSRRYSSRREAAEIEIGPEGVISGLDPGRYRLRATHQDGTVRDAYVEVISGQTAETEIDLGR